MELPWSSDTVRTVDIGRRLSATVALVVDDTEAMRKITVHQLRQLGVSKLLQASDGEDALRLLQTHPVSLVVADWQMPGMDGLALLRQMRALPKGASIPFLMLTAEAAREQVLQAVRLGVSELLVKPYTAGRFIERVERALFWQPSQAPLPADTTTSLEAGASDEGLPRPTVLVVDDTPDNLSLLSELFKGLYRVKVASSGAKALALCQSEEPPDLVLLDVMMPGMDGFEMARRLREHPASEDIPVIFVTALSDDAARLRGMSLGAVDFVTKPVQPDTLKLRVANFMRFVELRRHLQADYDQMLSVQRQQVAARSRQDHELCGPLENALDALRTVAGDEAAAARRGIQTALLAMAARTKSQALELEAYVFEPHDMRPVDVLRSALGVVASETQPLGLQWDLQLAQALDGDELQAPGDDALLYAALLSLLRLAATGAENRAHIGVSVWMRQTLRFEIDCPGLIAEPRRERLFDQPAPQAGGPSLSPRKLVEAQLGLLTLELDEAHQRSRIVLTLPTSPAGATAGF